MIGRKVRMGGLSAIVLSLLAAPAALAQPDPETIARECIERIGEITANCSRALLALGHEGARRVNDLQSQGEDEAARRAAHAAIEAINTHAARCTHRIRGLALNCVRVLERLDAPERLIEAVRQAAREGVGAVQRAREHAVGLVRAALND